MRIVYSSNNFKLSIYRSIISIIVGIVLVIWPGDAIQYMVILLGVFFALIGIISLISSYRLRKRIRREMEESGQGNTKETNPYARQIVSLNGMGSLIFGILLIAFHTSFIHIIMFVLGIVLIVAAIGQLTMLGGARRMGPVSPVSYIFPILILISGIIITVNPFESIETIFILFGATLIFYGITDILNQYGIRKMSSNSFKEEHPANGNNEDIEDADYEEVK